MTKLIDFAIVTALTEEFEEVKRQFPKLEKVSEDSQVWYRTTVQSADGREKYQVVVAYASKMGAFDMISLTKQVIDRWSPAYIIMTGIAGSFSKEIDLGDVLVSQQVFHYDEGKILDTPKGPTIEYRPQGYPCSVTLIRQSESLAVDKKWLKTAQSSKKKTIDRSVKDQTYPPGWTAPDKKPAVYFGTVASGSLVIMSTAKQAELLKLHGKIIGCEMEGAGLLHAVFQENAPTPAIVIKGVSDHADTGKAALDKNKMMRKIALGNAVSFVLDLVREGSFSRLNTDEYDLVAQKGTTAEARAVIQNAMTPPNTLICFPNLVVPSGPLTGLKLEIDVFNAKSPVGLLKGFVTYRTLAGDARQEPLKSTTITIDEPLAAAPVGIYLALSETAEKITFTTDTFQNKQQMIWP